MAIKTAVNRRKKAADEALRREMIVSPEAQARLAEIMADAPRIDDLNGTPWEIYALRNGVQYIIADEISNVVGVDGIKDMGYAEVVSAFAQSIPSIIKCVAYALVNDRQLLFKDGNPRAGKSEFFEATENTLMWECDPADLLPLLLDIFQLIDVDFFRDTLDIFAIFRGKVTAKKRPRKKVTSEVK